MDMILVDSDTDEGMFMLAFLQTLAKHQNTLVEEGKTLLGIENSKKIRLQDASSDRDFMTPIDYSTIVDKFSFRNTGFGKEEEIDFDYNMVSIEIAWRLVPHLPMLIFEKNNAQYPIDYFEFDKRYGNVLLSKRVEKIMEIFNVGSRDKE